MMRYFTKEEYISFLNEQNNDNYDIIESDPFEDKYAKTLSKINGNNNVVIDITSIKKEEIIKSIYNNTNLKIGDFFIKVTAYHKEPGNKEESASITLTIYENKEQLSFNRKVINKINPLKDSRFDNRPWLIYFNKFSYGTKVPINIIPDIIKWLQVLTKIPVFI